jgi:energy-coupling factor transporter ATP-binding protein EcfA2
MKLDKLILVNWGSLRSGEYDMGDMTLLTGPTGSGKSTLLDGLQTVMTAVYSNVFSYNPGQDETTQGSRNGKTKRTLWSYIVGAEDNLFARPDGAHGYIAAIFCPSEGEDGNPFTALVAAAARVDGSGDRRQAVMERLALLIVDDASLKLEDFVTVDIEGPLQVVPVEKIEGHLKAQYRQVTNFRDTKREYLCQLYGRFRGHKTVSFAEAELAAKAWSQSIAHKPIGSVDELVRDQILEHSPQQLSQRISQIGDLMRQVHNLRVEGERLKANVGHLENIGLLATRANEAYEKSVQYQLLASKRSLQEDNRQIEAAKKAIEKLKDNIKQEQHDSNQSSKEKIRLTNSLIQLRATLAGIPEAEQKHRIDDDLAKSGSEAANAVSVLLSSIGAAETMLAKAKDIAGMQFPLKHRLLSDAATKVVHALSSTSTEKALRTKPILEQLTQDTNQTTLDTRQAHIVASAFAGCESQLIHLYETLAAPEDSFVAALQMQLGQISTEVEAARTKEQELAQRKSNLAKGGADYPQHIRHALAQFHSDLGSARVQVLCDLIEPVSEEWQAAIEGYLGGARFNFVVDTAWEAQAIEFAKERHLRANVIQGSLCLRNAKPDQVRADSVIHELTTEHPIAKAYLVEQYGGVVKVRNTEELRHTPRGLTKDGKASGSRTMFIAEAHDNLVFGQDAKRKTFQRVDLEHQKAEQELKEVRNQSRELQGLLVLVGSLDCPSFSAAATLENAARAIEAGLADLGRINLTEVAPIEAEVTALEQQFQGFEKQIRESDERVGGHRNAMLRHELEMKRLDALQQDRFSRIEVDTTKLKRLAVINAVLSFSELEKQVDDLLAANQYSQQEVQGRIGKYQLDAEHHYGDVREAIADYNQHARADERFGELHGIESRDNDFGPVYGRLVQLLARVREQLNVQREIGLVKNIDELKQAEGSFKDVFTKQFCYEIRNAVDTGVKTLRALNVELDKLKFGTDKFRIDWSVWVSEFKEYYDFFTAAYDLSDSLESSDLFGTTELSPESCRVRDRLVGLLLSDDQDRALKELQRIADYRNYRRYEIWKESDSGSRVALSEWGTGSGGQLETPAYIVRAAVATNRLKHFDKGMKLKMLVNDESFAKMDERRAHDVIRFIRDSLGIQLICAMPTKHAGAIKTEFTKEWCFTRTGAEVNGEVDFISEADERDLNPDKLRELWDKRRQEVRLQVEISLEEEEKTIA